MRSPKRRVPLGYFAPLVSIPLRLSTATAIAPLPAPPKRPELLAPAGDWVCARASVEKGADAL